MGHCENYAIGPFINDDDDFVEHFATGGWSPSYERRPDIGPVESSFGVGGNDSPAGPGLPVSPYPIGHWMPWHSDHDCFSTMAMGGSPLDSIATVHEDVKYSPDLMDSVTPVYAPDVSIVLGPQSNGVSMMMMGRSPLNSIATVLEDVKYSPDAMDSKTPVYAPDVSIVLGPQSNGASSSHVAANSALFPDGCHRTAEFVDTRAMYTHVLTKFMWKKYCMLIPFIINVRNAAGSVPLICVNMLNPGVCIPDATADGLTSIRADMSTYAEQLSISLDFTDDLSQ